mmetsp:Transcript_17434/g.36194  ORF Transcript_17434/g.36194 Transcript_17434/m.36194 type:complete len:139 (-) Transcript_17434:500-916(-)
MERLAWTVHPSRLVPNGALSEQCRRVAAGTDTIGCRVCESLTLTLFQKRVYHVCANIPSGFVSTYADIAQTLRSSPRAVGQALKRNPFNNDDAFPRVPCHRVVKRNCDLGGFKGEANPHSEAVRHKLELLEEEVRSAA